MRRSGSTKRLGRGAEIRSFRVVFLIGVCALFSLAAASCTQPQGPAQKTTAEAQLPPSERPPVTQVDDAKIKQLLKPAGKPLLVNFWATWCGPCREEFPDLVKIDEEYRGRIEFFTVTLDFVEEIDKSVPQFMDDVNAKMPTYLLASADENAFISSISKDWSGALPFTILHGADGEVSFFRQGKVDRETLKSEIDKALKK